MKKIQVDNLSTLPKIIQELGLRLSKFKGRAFEELAGGWRNLVVQQAERKTQTPNGGFLTFGNGEKAWLGFKWEIVGERKLGLVKEREFGS